jgi:tRNA(adenine34) deaminase
MRAAQRAGRASIAEGERGRGAVVLVGDDAITTVDRSVSRGDPTAHAVMLALQEAGAAHRSWRLAGASVVATHEPCAMCAGALVAARVERVVFGLADAARGAVGSRYGMASDPRLGRSIEVVAGFMAGTLADLDRPALLGGDDRWSEGIR